MLKHQEYSLRLKLSSFCFPVYASSHWFQIMSDVERSPYKLSAEWLWILILYCRCEDFSHMRETHVRFMKSLVFYALCHCRFYCIGGAASHWGSENRARFFWANSSLRLLNGRTLDGGAFNWSLSSSSMRIIVTLCRAAAAYLMRAYGEGRDASQRERRQWKMGRF